MQKSLIVTLFCICKIGLAQVVGDSITLQELNKINIYLDRYLKKSTQEIENISIKQIELLKCQNTAELLSSTGTVSVQKSQQGGGSPILRGFEANKILLLVDGIRMNNLIYRSGHLQNIISVDENILSQIDILFGPSSTAFGSDAMGGVINLKTKTPSFISETNPKMFTGNIMTRFNSANSGASGYFDLNFAGIKWSSLTTFSYNRYGDLRMGSNPKKEPFGERYYYIKTIENVDFLVNNKNPLIQIFSGYQQYNAMQKIYYQQDDKTQHSLNLQYSTTSDVPRYDRLTDKTSTGELKYAEWNYGPQKRFLGAYKLFKSNFFWNCDMNIGLSYQLLEESRITRKFNNDILSTQNEKVNVYAFNLDFRKNFNHKEFLYGAEIFYDDLNSTATNTNRKSGKILPADTRYPNGINFTFRYDIFAIYNSYINKTTLYNLGVRTGFAKLKSTINSSSLNLPYNYIEQNNFTYSGTVGVIKNLKNSSLTLNIASAYRVPNVDDLGKLFESIPGKLIVPNPKISPEKSVTTDFSIEIKLPINILFKNTIFYTRLYDAIISDVFTLNGNGSMFYEGVESKIYAMQNKGEAYIYGFASMLKINFIKSFQFYGTLSYTKGRIIENSVTTPLDHISPIFGKTGLKYENKFTTLDLYILYNGKKDINEYFLNGEDNEKYAPAGGINAWQTLNCKGMVNITPKLSIYVGVENIFDLQYRVFASGINSAGRNASIGAGFNF